MQRSKSIQGRRLEAIEEKAKLLKNIDQTEHLKLSQPVYHSHRLASFRNVSICYENNIICKDITFTIEQGDRIALNGNNGCGKSSILKLVCGYNVPYSGEFYKGSNMMISYVSQIPMHYAEPYPTMQQQQNCGKCIQSNFTQIRFYKRAI